MEQPTVSPVSDISYGELETAPFSSITENGVYRYGVAYSSYHSTHRGESTSDVNFAETLSSISPFLAQEFERILFHRRSSSLVDSVAYYSRFTKNHSFYVKEIFDQPLYILGSHSSYSGMWSVRDSFEPKVGRIERVSTTAIVDASEIEDDCMWEIYIPFSNIRIESVRNLSRTALAVEDRPENRTLEEKISGFVELNNTKSLLVCSNRDDAQVMASRIQEIISLRRAPRMRDSLPVGPRKINSSASLLYLNDIHPNVERLRVLTSVSVGLSAANWYLDISNLLLDGSVPGKVAIRKLPLYTQKLERTEPSKFELVSPSGLPQMYKTSPSDSKPLEPSVDFLFVQRSEERNERSSWINRGNEGIDYSSFFTTVSLDSRIYGTPSSLTGINVSVASDSVRTFTAADATVVRPW